MKNQSSRLSRIVSYVTLGTAAVSVLQMFASPEPSQAMSYGLNSAAYLLLSLALMFRPDEPVLFLAVFLMGVLSGLALVGERHHGPAVFIEHHAQHVRLLALLVALLAVGISEAQARLRPEA